MKPFIVNPNEPNALLYPKWREVFRKIPGFENCICLRRVRCPTGAKDMDFFLLTQDPVPMIGLVECEGKNHKVPLGVEQLLTYIAHFSEHRGHGQRILDVSVKDAFDTTKARGALNTKQHGNFRKWYQDASPRIRGEDELVRLLGKASRKLVPILLYYRDDGLRDRDSLLLGLAFRKHRLYIGTVDHSTLELVQGIYLP